MSHKEITITTAEGNMLGLFAARIIECKVRRAGLLIVERTFSKKVIVQYGIGIAGEGSTLKAAVDDFRKNWSASCAARQSQERHL